ncbi:MAG: hypothetical protein EBZ83_05445 [Verrucomicrobia bacterium]|nr:hypothetical protein [Verrucomicrobiota bacterium]
MGHTNSPLTTGVRTVGADGKELSGIIQAAAGGNHSLLLRNLGGQLTLLVAGANANGQLGITNAFSDRFLPVSSGLPTNLLAIAAGARHSMALDADGKVYAWGDNLQGQVGVNTNRSVIRTPTRVTNALATLRIKAVAAGAEHSLALADDGTVYSWGRGNGGALGYTVLGAVRAPRQITNLSSIRQIAAGDKHSLFLNAGKVYACGDNSLGQLGLPSSVLSTNTPVEIPFPAGVTIRKLVAGLDRCLAIAEDGRVFGWGYNRYGELGLGFASTNAPYAVFQPQEVRALFGAKEVRSRGHGGVAGLLSLFRFLRGHGGKRDSYPPENRDGDNHGQPAGHRHLQCRRPGKPDSDGGEGDRFRPGDRVAAKLRRRSQKCSGDHGSPGVGLPDRLQRIDECPFRHRYLPDRGFGGG